VITGIGGLFALIENFRPRELWTGTNPLPALLDRAARLLPNCTLIELPESKHDPFLERDAIRALLDDAFHGRRPSD